MPFERRGAMLSAIMGSVGSGISVLPLGLRYSSDDPVILGIGLGVAVTGFVHSVGMVGWVYISEADGGSLYIYLATVASASVLMLVSASNEAQRSDPSVLPLLLVGGATFITVGFSLVFVSELCQTRGQRCCFLPRTFPHRRLIHRDGEPRPRRDVSGFSVSGV
jgi:hypothetical protein